MYIIVTFNKLISFVTLLPDIKLIPIFCAVCKVTNYLKYDEKNRIVDYDDTYCFNCKIDLFYGINLLERFDELYRQFGIVLHHN